MNTGSYKRRKRVRQTGRSGRRKRKTGFSFVLRGLLLVLITLLVIKFVPDPDERQAPGIGQDISFAADEPSVGTCIASPGIIPDYSGDDYIELNNNIPNFTEYDLAHLTGETFSQLDSLGRCGPATAMLDRTKMPEQERGSIGDVKPSGWHTVKYPDRIEDGYLYNRCHLIAYAMTGQNDNPLNLITGTRYLNKTTMLPFELIVLRYLDDSDHHVLYRVTPFFKGSELVARGVEMEAYSVEDHGAGVRFHVFVYNYQPGITIDYATGESQAA